MFTVLEKIKLKAKLETNKNVHYVVCRFFEQLITLPSRLLKKKYLTCKDFKDVVLLPQRQSHPCDQSDRRLEIEVLL